MLLAGGAVLMAVEARLDLPDPLIPGSAMAAELIITDGAAPAKVVLPQVPGLAWEVRQGGRQETRIVNGVTSSTSSVVLAVQAEHEGEFAIPAFTITLRDGSTVTVPATQARCAPGDARLTGDLVAEARFVPDRIVPGETAQLEYTIWLRRGDIQSLGIAPPGESLSLGERQLVQGRTFDQAGQPWTKVTVTWPLTFAEPGSYRVAGQQDCRIQIGDGFFDQRSVVRRAAVAPATITVAELPTEGRPADFTGLIGEVTVEGRLDRTAIAAGEGARFELVVHARQADLVRRPTLALPTGVAAYPVEEGPADPSGTRTFRWDVVPSATGEVAIPALAIPWFDPASRSYRSASSAPLTLTVRPGRSRDLGLVGGSAPTTGTAQPVEARQASGLPAPARRHQADPPGPEIAAGVGAFALLIGLAAGLWARRPRRGPHRGQALRNAIETRDAAAIQAALALMPTPPGPARTAADQLRERLESHRFGGAPLPPSADLHALAAPLEAIP